MPVLGKQVISNYLRSDCQRRLRLDLYPDTQRQLPNGQTAQQERHALGLPPRLVRPGLEALGAAGEEWEEAKLNDLVHTLGLVSLVGISQRTQAGTYKFADTPMASLVAQAAAGVFLVQGQFDVGPAFELALGIQHLRMSQNMAYRQLRPDLVQVFGANPSVQRQARLSRSLTDFAKLVDVFERNSVTFVSVTQSFCTTTSMSRLTLNILLSFAQFERELAGERIRDKIAASRRKGIFMGGQPPLGYDVRDRKLVVNPAEAELVRLIFRRFLDLGSALLLIRELNAQGHRTKSWTTQAGTFREGRPFDKGTLYKILRNPVYIGLVTHRGQSYPGEHEPIVDRATWDRMHEVLATNAKRRGNEARARTPAPLRGLMRCTHCSSAMTPTHTRRRGRLYRYYVCLGASRRGHDTCPVRSIAASEVENLVLAQVRRLLASPEVVARTITAVERENGAAADAEFAESEVIEALAALEPVWDELYPAEQARIMRLLIERIEVAPDGISVTLHAAGIRSLVAELADQEAPAPVAPEPLLEAAE